MVFHRSMSDNKSSQVSRTLLSILADLSNTVIWIVSTRRLISNSPSAFTNPLVTLPRAPITSGITVTFMFHSFFQFPSYLSFSLSFNFTLRLARTANSTIPQVFFLFFFFSFLDDYYKVWSSGRDRWSVCISKSQRSLCISFSRYQT